jgi:(4S)-4-hydroxy-5-phosphonooxypentane-2,3-dione isomerase
MHIVAVVFNIHAAHYRAFIDAVVGNARTSVEAEAGCHQFDVCEAPGANAHQVFLYEVYGSPEDFQAHLATPHYLQFNALTAPWVIDKKVNLFERISPAA